MTKAALNSESIAQLFHDAHTVRQWTSAPVDPDIVQRAYDEAKWAPTAFNANPIRLIRVTSPEARATVAQLASKGNKNSVESAPVLLLAAYDTNFIDGMEHMGSSEYVVNMLREADWAPDLAPANAWIQLGYMIISLRAQGLDVHPMSGANMEGLNQAFLADSSWKTFMMICAGHGDPEGISPRLGRLSFEEASKTV
ncbi:MAG: malonic semialdehyde reductase [Actinomycetaceae bacterium]|nr:malonic semialdehyde reductase [Actinomycetaceae bacterium]